MPSIEIPVSRLCYEAVSQPGFGKDSLGYPGGDPFSKLFLVGTRREESSDVRPTTTNLLEERAPSGAWHLKVRNYDVERLALENGECFAGGACKQNIEGDAQLPLQNIPKSQIIIDEEKARPSAINPKRAVRQGSLLAREYVVVGRCRHVGIVLVGSSSS